MCGIIGIYSPIPQPAVSKLEALRMALGALRHRGVDGAGVWAEGLATSLEESQPGDAREAQRAVDRARELWPVQACSRVWLGHRLLAITDRPRQSMQPFVRGKAAAALALAYNGEIYNYRELRAEIEGASGVLFDTRGDTELVLRAYETWGEAAFGKFNGMWALALWDGRKNRLVLSRDRFGIKPLFLRFHGEELWFASETAPLLQLGSVTANEDFLERFLAIGTVVDGAQTLYREIFPFPPGFTCVLDPATAVSPATLPASSRRYWDYPEVTATPLAGDGAKDELRHLLTDSLRLRAVGAGREIGLALSGGLDSTTLGALGAALVPQGLRTYSTVFPGRAISEKPSIEAFLARYPSCHRYLQPSATEVEAKLDEILGAHGGILPSASGIAQWFVFQAAHADGLRVVLSGQGADELLGGYEAFLLPYLKTVRGNAGSARALAEAVPVFAKAHRYFVRKMWARGTAPAPKASFASPPRYADPLRESLFRAMTSTSLPTLLHVEDINSMRSSVETRLPFLDHRLVEFCFRLAPAELLAGGTRKRILRRAMAGALPAEILEDHRKLGFPAPEREWLAAWGVREPWRAWRAAAFLRSLHITHAFLD